MENLAEKTDFKRLNFALDRFNFFIYSLLKKLEIYGELNFNKNKIW